MSNISCDCSVDHDSGPSCSTQVIRRARKKHSCVECGEDIMPGDKYENYSGIWDGKANEYKTCLPCMRVRDRYCSSGWIFGDVAEHIRECLGFDYREVPELDEEEAEQAERDRMVKFFRVPS